MDRNFLLVRFMLYYGLSIQDIITLSMHDIHFGTNIITPGGLHAYKRSITLSKEDVKLALSYYKQIPKLIRPRLQTGIPSLLRSILLHKHSVGIMTKINRCLNKNRRSTDVTKEAKRAEIKVTPTMLRNRFILNALQNGMKPIEIKAYLGLKALKHCIDTLNSGIKSKTNTI